MKLTVENISKTIDGKDILSQLNLQVEGAKIIGLLGPNGSGKTTLMKIIAGLMQPNQGRLLINNQSYHYPQTSQQIAYLPDSLIFPKSYSIKQACTYFRSNYFDFNEQKFQQILADLELDMSRKLSSMSKGQQERLMLALVLARESQLVLLDEPLAAIDVISRDEILRLLKTYSGQHTTYIITTHLILDMQDLFDEVLFLNRGQVVFHSLVAPLCARENKSLLDIYRSFYGYQGVAQGGTY